MGREILSLLATLENAVVDALVLGQLDVAVNIHAIAVLLGAGLVGLLAVRLPALVSAGLEGGGVGGVGRVLEVATLAAFALAAVSALATILVLAAVLVLVLALAARVALAVFLVLLVLAVVVAAPRVRVLARRVLRLAGCLASIRGVLPLPRAALAAIFVGVELQDVACDMVITCVSNNPPVETEMVWEESLLTGLVLRLEVVAVEDWQVNIANRLLVVVAVLVVAGLLAVAGWGGWAGQRLGCGRGGRGRRLAGVDGRRRRARRGVDGRVILVAVLLAELVAVVCLLLAVVLDGVAPLVEVEAVHAVRPSGV